jgi:hypothetical protein
LTRNHFRTAFAILVSLLIPSIRKELKPLAKESFIGADLIKKTLAKRKTQIKKRLAQQAD